MTKIEEIRNKVELGEFCISNVQTTDFPGGYPNYNDSWNQDKFKEKFRIEVKSCGERDMEFDMIGIDCSIANSLRRIMLSEVSTMAIDKVQIMNNTSLIQDEVLAHRLGLIPIAVDPTVFVELEPTRDTQKEIACVDDTIKFTLKVKCTRNPDASKDAIDPDEMYINHTVKSNMFKWEPIEEQNHLFPEGIEPADDDIIIAKMRPGQELNVVMYCYKGNGRTHAKFSPVATASYRLHPEIVLTKSVIGDLAYKLQKCFPEGVIGIKGKADEAEAFVENSRLDTSSREVLRHEDLRDCVKLFKIRDHFIFSIESTGAIPPEIIFLQSIAILQNKTRKLVSEIRNEDEPEEDAALEDDEEEDVKMDEE